MKEVLMPRHAAYRVVIYKKRTVGGEEKYFITLEELEAKKCMMKA